MNERGFFTLIGICFLIVVAVIVRGVQESEGNYYSIAEDFQTAAELQNIADSALIEAAELIQSGEVELKNAGGLRRERQYEVPLNMNYDADVKVFYEYGIDTKNNKTGNIFLKEKLYPAKDIINVKEEGMKGAIIISVASRDTAKGKVYRRALGYFFTDENEETPTKIYFLNDFKEN